MLQAILVDDEANSLSALREKILRHCPQVSIIATCESAKEAIQKIETLKPDLVFLDIEMPLMNGFLMLQELHYRAFELIFTTAYDHYAIRAIRFSALDYLMKPVEVEELRMAVGRAEEKRGVKTTENQLDLLLESMVSRMNPNQRIAIPTNDGLQFIRLSEIVYLEANINYTYFTLTENRRYIVSRTLKDFEEILPGDTFLRIHNSYMVNKNFIEKYIRGEGGQVALTNGVLLDVAKRKKADFLKAIGY